MSAKKNGLIKKDIISQDNFSNLFDSINVHPIYDPELHVLIKQKANGYYTLGHVDLTTMGVVHKKCWFINSGMVMGVIKTNNGKVIPLIFDEGKFAILPDSFFFQHLPNCYFVACPDTHLLELNIDDVNEIFKKFPETRELSNKIISLQATNAVERAAIMGRPAKERVIELHRVYKDIVGPNRKVKLLDRHQAAFLGISKGTFSKLLKQIYG